jgi:hypothetical protein
MVERGMPPLPRITPHSLRSTYISIALLANKFHVEYVMGQVGHADSKMIMDVYAQLEQRVKRDHGASFDRLVRQARELGGEDRTIAEAGELSSKSHRRRNRRLWGVETGRAVTTRNRPEEEKRKWRDSESNRGHHDFQTVVRILR